jgi:ribosomal protein S18 acetylase RimI-like enzyme
LKFFVDHALSESRIHTVHGWLANHANWARGRTLETQRKAMQASLNFFVSRAGALVGYGRVVTDGAVFSHLNDVIVPPELRGQGISRALMEAVMAHEVANNRLLGLNTSTAHGLYKKFGFAKAGADGATYMRILKPHVA